MTSTLIVVSALVLIIGIVLISKRKKNKSESKDYDEPASGLNEPIDVFNYKTKSREENLQIIKNRLEEIEKEHKEKKGDAKNIESPSKKQTKTNKKKK